MNKIIGDYQRKLNDARQAPKDTEQAKKLKADFDRQCVTNARLAEKLKEKSDELAEARSLADRRLVQLNALEEYSKVVKARADRLRERQVYLNKVRTVSRKADQARSTWKCLQRLAKAGVKIPQKALDDMEKDALSLEAKFKEFEPVELQEGDLSPLEAYAPSSDEPVGLPETEVPSEHHEDELMQDASVEETLEAAPVNEEEGGGGTNQ